METVVIAGGSGMVGKRLVELLKAEGYKTLVLSRSKKSGESEGTILWDINKGQIDEAFATADHIVNLSGAGIADSRWTRSRKKEILESRTLSTALLIAKLAEYDMNIQSFVSASAVGYYGNSGDRLMDEDMPAGSDFLAEICQHWEEAAKPAAIRAKRLVILRIGVVLERGAGALPKMAATVPFGIASYLGSGQQYMPWIHIDDLCNMFIEAIRHPHMSGIYNATAPRSIQQKDFMRILKEEVCPLARLIPAPALALKLLLGEMSSVVLNSNKVTSQKIVDVGFEFLYPNLEEALSVIYQ